MTLMSTAQAAQDYFLGVALLAGAALLAVVFGAAVLGMALATPGFLTGALLAADFEAGLARDFGSPSFAASLPDLSAAARQGNVFGGAFTVPIALKSTSLSASLRVSGLALRAVLLPVLA